MQIYLKPRYTLVSWRELVYQGEGVSIIVPLPANFEYTKTTTMIATLTDANFDEIILKSDKLSIVDFWATWCPPCIAIGPTIEALARDYEGKATVGKLNVDENANTSVAYGAMNLPVVLFILNGKVVDKQVGAAHRSVYEKKIKKILEG